MKRGTGFGLGAVTLVVRSAVGEQEFHVGKKQVQSGVLARRDFLLNGLEGNGSKDDVVVIRMLGEKSKQTSNNIHSL